MRSRAGLAFIGLLLVSGALAQTFKPFSGKVVGVTDGDTISVMRDEKAAKIRLHGIDCPEFNQPFGTKAKQFASDMVFGKVVRVECRSTGTDKYGRLLGNVVRADGKILNHELLRAGLAWWYRQYAPKDKDLAALEAEARTAKRGLWADKDPVAPWDFRHGTGPKAPREAVNKQGPKESDPREATVYVTRTGKKYHREGCRYLRSSKIPISRKQAIKEGYEPCSVCAPSSMQSSFVRSSYLASSLDAVRHRRPTPQAGELTSHPLRRSGSIRNPPQASRVGSQVSRKSLRISSISPELGTSTIGAAVGT